MLLQSRKGYQCLAASLLYRTWCGGDRCHYSDNGYTCGWAADALFRYALACADAPLTLGSAVTAQQGTLWPRVRFAMWTFYSVPVVKVDGRRVVPAAVSEQDEAIKNLLQHVPEGDRDLALWTELERNFIAPHRRKHDVWKAIEALLETRAYQDALALLHEAAERKELVCPLT